MPQIKVHLIGQLHYFVISGWVNVAGFHVVVKQTVSRAVQVDFALNNFASPLTDHSSGCHVLFERKILED